MADLQALVTIQADDRASRTVAHIGDEFDNLGRRANVSGLAVAAGITAIGAAVAGGIKIAFDLGEAFDAAYDRIRIGTGATGDRLESLQQQFREVARSGPDSFENVAIAVTEVARRFQAGDEQASILAGTFLDLSRITGTDLNENIRLSARLFGDWGVQVGQQVPTLDLLFRASQQTGASLGSLQQLLVQYGAPLRQLGFGLTESIALLSKFEAEGVNTELVMGSLRIALGNLADANIPLRDGFQEVLRVIRDAPTDVEATSQAIAIFGARAGPDMAAAIREGRFAIDGLVSSLEGGTGTIATTASATEDARERMATAFNEMRIAAEPVVTAVFLLGGAIAEDLAGAVTAIAPDLSSFIASLSPGAEQAAGRAQKGVGSFTAGVIGMGEPIRLATGLVQGLNSAFEDTDRRVSRFLRQIPIVNAAVAALEQPGPLSPFRENETPFGPTLAELQEGAIRRAQTGSPGGRLAPVNEAQLVSELEALVAASTGPHPGQAPPEAPTREGQQRQTPEDIAARVRAMIDAANRAAASGERSAQAAGARVAESAIEGFIAGLRGGEADAQAEFGSLGGKLATALNEALAGNSRAGGVAVARTLEDVVTALRTAGVEDWRELGDQLAAALHDALIARTPEQAQAARQLIAELTTTIDAAQFWAKWATEGEKSADRINIAQQNAAERITAANRTAGERVQQIWDNLNLTRRLEEARATVEGVVDTLRRAQEQGAREIQTGRENRDVATQRLREDADRRAALEQRIADIRKRGGATVGQDVRAAQEAFDRETAQIEQRRGREDTDRRQRRADQAFDLQRAEGNRQNIGAARRGAEEALGITNRQLADQRAAEQVAGIWRQTTTEIDRFNESFAETIRKENQALQETFQTLQRAHPRLFQGEGVVLPTGDHGNGNLPTGDKTGTAEGMLIERTTEIHNNGIIVDMSTFTEMTLEAETQTEQDAVAAQGT